MIFILLIFEKEIENDCLDSECSIILINRVYLVKINLELSIKIITNFIIVRRIKFNRYQISKYVITPFYFFKKNTIIITILKEIYIVDEFKINILININIIIFEKIDIFIF